VNEGRISNTNFEYGFRIKDHRVRAGGRQVAITGAFSIATAALGLAIAAACGWAQQSGGGVPIVMPLMGRTLSQVVAQLGRPIEAIPLRETGGKLLIFENSQGDHYIIETDASNHVVEAAVKHPQGR
jgi:hypothetical protein